MSVESLNCPNCGAPLPDTGRSVVVCDHCGSSIRIQNSPPAPDPLPAGRRPVDERPATGAGVNPTDKYGPAPGARPERSALASVTLGAPDVAEIVRLLRERQNLTAIQLYQSKVGGSLGDAKDAIEAIQAGLKDASAPLPPPSATPRSPDMDRVYELVKQGNRIEAIKQYRLSTGTGLRESKTVVDGIERQYGRAAGRVVARPATGLSGTKSCLSMLAVVVVFVMCIFGGCGTYLQTKSVYRCSMREIKAALAQQEMLRAPITGGLLVISPGFEESYGGGGWLLNAEYYAPVWGQDGFGIIYARISGSSDGSDEVTARFYQNGKGRPLLPWTSLECP